MGGIMKIALITYYLRMNDYPTKYSLAALRLGEYLNSSGIDVELVPVALVDLDFAEFVKEKIEGKYDIVGERFNYVYSKDHVGILPRMFSEDDGVMSYEKVEIIRRNDGSIRFNNKMPYHVTLGYIGTNGVTMLPQTQSLMVTPFSYANTQFKNVPSTFQVGYINDFGGLSFYEINCPVVNNICNISVANRDQ